MRILKMLGLIIVGALAVFLFQVNMQERDQAMAAAPAARDLSAITTYEPNNAFTRDQMQAALAQLKTSCAPLFTDYADDIESIKINGDSADCSQPGDYKCDEYGWGQRIKINVKITGDRKVIPVKYRARGHTLHYWLGAGRQPGIMSLKDQSKYVCEWSHTPTGSSYFVSVPELSGIIN